MGFFLRKENRSKGIYYSIRETYRIPGDKNPKNKTYKTYGYENDLIASGIDNPEEYLKGIVNQLNSESRRKKESSSVQVIGEDPAFKNLGYFLFYCMFRHLDVSSDLDLFSSPRKFQFSVAQLLCQLVCARAVCPCSKRKTAVEVIPSLYGMKAPAYDQILEALEFLGENYEKIVECFTFHTDETYILDTNFSLFDCSNFYFEIDREDEIRRKGPSKENRRDPIIGMGLLLDANAIPIGMKLYPGNQSEKPVLRNLISDLKKRGRIGGRTIQVADKGLNCARNIIECTEANDGYLFSKSIKSLPEIEKTWILSSDPMTAVLDEDGEVKFKYKSCIADFKYSYKNDDGRTIRKTCREKRILTYNPKLAAKQRAELEKMADKAQLLCLKQAARAEFGDMVKFVNFKAEDEDGNKSGKVKVEFNFQQLEEDKKLCGYNLLVTSELRIDDEKIYDLYHQLSKIEDSFRCLKSQLDARPVYLQKESRIYGHFLVCYITVLIQRLLQYKVFSNMFSSDKIYSFVRSFCLGPCGVHKWINGMGLAEKKEIITYLSDYYNLPVQKLYLSRTEIKKILAWLS